MDFVGEWDWVAPFGVLLVSLIVLLRNYRRTGRYVPKWKKTKSIKTLTADIVGRDETIKDLYDHFYVTSAPIALTGIGGIGKTVLAEAFAKSQLAQSIFHDSILLPLGSESEMAKKLERIGAKLDMPFSDNAAAYIGLVFDAMQASRKRYLLIYDNVDSKEERKLALRNIPASENISVIITSQYNDWRPPVKMIPIGPLSKEKAVELFAKESGLPVDNALKKLAIETLECLPLPIIIAAADLRTEGTSLDWYNARIKNPKYDIPESSSYEKSTYVALKLAFERLTDETKTLLELAAFMDPEDIYAEFFVRGVEGIKKYGFDPLPEPFFSAAQNTIRVNRLLREAETHSLLYPATSQNQSTYRMHKITQLVLRDMIGDRVGKIAGFVARLGSAQLSGNLQFDTHNWPYYHRLVRHAETLVSFAKSIEGGDGKYLIRLANSMSVFLVYATGDFSRAIRMGEGVLGTIGRLYGQNSIEYATALSNLAGTMGQLALTLIGAEREEMDHNIEMAWKEAIKITADAHKQDLSLASLHNQLGGFYWDRNRFSDAESEWLKTLNLSQSQGADVHVTARHLGNLGSLYSEWARSKVDPAKIMAYRKKALDFKTKALNKTRESLGEINQETAISHYNLALQYHDDEKFESALSHSVSAFAIMEIMADKSMLARDHPNFIRTYEFLSLVKHEYEKIYETQKSESDLIENAKEKVLSAHRKWQKNKTTNVENSSHDPLVTGEQNGK